MHLLPLTRKALIPVAACLLAFSLFCEGAPPEPARLTLNQAIDLALKNNHAILIDQGKVAEMRSALRKVRADYFPQVTNTSSFIHLTDTDLVQFSQGSFGTFPGVGTLPTTNLKIGQGDRDQILSRSQIGQPLTQLLRVHEGTRAAKADEGAAQSDLAGLRNHIALGVLQLYYALVSTKMDLHVSDEQLRVTEEQLSESQQEVNRGEALEVSLTEARTKVLQAKQDQLTTAIRQSDLFADFDNVVGLPPGTEVEVEQPGAIPEQTGGNDNASDLPNKVECVRLAQSLTPEIASAQETVTKTEAAIKAAKFEYIPDLSVFARHDYQNGVAFLLHNYGVLGAEFKYTLFNGNRRQAEIGEHEAQRTQAMENLRRLKDEAAANIERAFGKIEQSRSLVAVARQLVDLRTEAGNVADSQFRHGTILPSKRSEAGAALTKAQADLVKAELGYLEAKAAAQVLIGRTPR